ncbi:failed axon connections homolog isoform X1 [Penaeus vannamei]|uniref:failed axon connections homolog isoform X1 n=1 Tax=Penaeus vannamei TaxID=6689 RepID=UPI000F67351B|nr:failed axon connections homolog isoform X1 [Penaeus vannamei]
MALAALLWEMVRLWWSFTNGAVLMVFAAAGGLWLAVFYLSDRKKNRDRWQQAGRDVIVVHCLSPGRFTPNTSPFVMKLLTFLRLARLPHLVDHEEPFGPKGKTPWITLNGEDFTDSHLIIEMLSDQYNIDLTNSLTAEQRAAAKAFTVMIDEHVCWCLRAWRFGEDGGSNLKEGLSLPFYKRLLFPLFVREQRTALWHQGVGRHSHAAVRAMMKEDLLALSKYLGDKPFLMGDTACAVDCSMFAFLANILYNYNRSPYYAVVNEELVNLRQYVERLKSQLWPDWDECLASP